MNKSDVLDILNKIKTNYQDFLIKEDTLNNWYEVLKDYSYLEIDGKLNDYLKADSDKPPRLNHLTSGIQTIAQKTNSLNNDFVWCNLCQKKMRFRYYESHYSRCLQVHTIWKNLKIKGHEIPRDELEQYGDDLLEKLEAKYIDYQSPGLAKMVGIKNV